MVDDKNNDDDYGKSPGGLTDVIKKVFAVGMSAAFMTEESIRNALGEVKLPKEILKSLLDGALNAKSELLNRVSAETIKMINKIDFVKEASRFVETHKFKVTAEIEVEKKENPKSSS